MKNYFHSINPATGEIIWEGPAATATDVNTAISLARSAFSNWSNLEIDQRIAYLKRYAEILKEREERIAEIISMETGKPLWESKNEISTVQNKVALSIDAYHDRCAEVNRKIAPGQLKTQYKPHGVLAIFGPFNFPLHLPNAHIIPALLAGNTLVFKPSELTPRTGEELIKAWKDIGLPNGVIQLLQGGSETGKQLSSNTEIDGILFTGSFKTGKILSELYGSQPQKILALEMGGNNPLVIHHINDLKWAAFTTFQSAYLTSGQRCTCARRLILTDSVDAHAFIEEFSALVESIKIGKYTDLPEPYMGPVITEIQALHLLQTQARLINLGGIPLIKMQQLYKGTGFVSPALIDVTPITDKPDEEYFGPLLQLIRVKDLNEAIAEANRTRYGLIAGLLCDHEEEYRKFYRLIRAGLINWNTPLTGASSHAPFGGIGWSGNHRPSAYHAADYCAYPVASIENPMPCYPSSLPPGLRR